MSHRVWNWLLCACFCSLLLSSCRQEYKFTPVVSKPLLQAHAHNDYAHKRPLLDALDHQFTSVEADIHLAKGKLLVAHWWWNRDPKKTFRKLYLNPLRARVKKNKGCVHPGCPRFILLVDIKTSADSTYRALHKMLLEYKEMLTSYHKGKVKKGAVTVIVSGNRPLSFMKKQTTRYAFYDGRPGDLKSKEKASLIPLVSQKWSRMFGWSGSGTMPPKQLKKLHAYVKKAHQQGRMVRFWATPDRRTSARQQLWKVLFKAGVDLINTDDLTGFQQFLLEQRPSLKVGLPAKR